MLTNDDINILKAIIYASKRVPEATYDASKFSIAMDKEIQHYLNLVSPTQFLKA